MRFISRFSFLVSTLKSPSLRKAATISADRDLISSMENENQDSLLTQKVIQCLQLLEQSGTDGQAEIKETLKQFLLGRNTGANAVSNCEMDVDVIEEKEEVEDATLYIRVGGQVLNTSGLVESDFKWFVIPPRGVVDSEGYICSLFQEPYRTFEILSREDGIEYTPHAVGPYIVLITNVIHESTPKRDVLYRNTQNEEGWKDANPVVGEYARTCHFIVADEKIYAFGSVDNGNSLVVSSFDCQKPDQEWKVGANAINVGPPLTTGLFNSLYYIIASTIEYDTTTTVEGKPGRRARRALLFANWFRITYDFEANSYVYSEEFLYWEPWCGVCPDGGEIYLLIHDFKDGSVSIKVYDYHEMKWGMTPVLGLDKYLPVAPREDYNLPPSRLVHLGNKRLCLVYALYRGAKIYVHCTKFSVRVQEGKYYATKVSSKVYKLNASPNIEFDVVAVCTSNEKILKFGEDNAVGVESRSGKHKLTMGAKATARKQKKKNRKQKTESLVKEGSEKSG